METDNTIQDEAHKDNSTAQYPPKPVMADSKQSSVTRSLVSLFIYGFLFYLLFDRNIGYIAAVLLTIVIHELGHFFAMKAFRYTNVKLFIIPLLGGFVSGKKQQVSQLQLSLIILAGPLPGIIIGLLLLAFGGAQGNETLKMLSNTFLFINLFNLLPIFPLDGGRLLEALFMKQNHIIRLVFGIISVMILVVLFILSFNLILLLVPALMVWELYNETKNQKIRDYLRQERLDYQLEYQHLSDRSYWLIRDCILFSYPKKYQGVLPGQYSYSIAEPLLMQQVNAILQINLRLDLGALGQALTLILYLVVLIGTPVLYYFLLHK